MPIKSSSMERRPNLCFKRFVGWLFVAGLVIFVNVFFHSVHSVHDARVRASQLEAKVLGALESAFGRGVRPAATSSHPLNGTCTAAWMVKGACFPGGDIRSFPGSDDGSECCAACLAHNTRQSTTFSKAQPPCIGWTLVWTSGATAHCHLKSKLAGTPESSMRCVSGKVNGRGEGALSSSSASTASNQEWAEAKAATEHLATAKHHTAAGRHKAAAKHTTAAEHHAVAAEHAAADGQLAAADGLRGEGSSSSSSSSFDDRFTHPKAVNRASVVIIQAMPSRRLLLQRRTSDYPVKAFAGGLCLFGGNWEAGEPPRETMLRELAEEFNHGEYTQSEVEGAGERGDKTTGKVKGNGKHSQHLTKTKHAGRSATKTGLAASKKSKTNTSEGGLFGAVRDTATLVGIFDIVVSRTKVLAPDADFTGSAKGGSAEPDYAFIASVFLATVSDTQAEAGLATMTEGSGELVPMPELTRGRSGAGRGVRGGGGGEKKKKKAGGEKGGEKGGTETKMETEEKEEKEETPLRFAWGYGAVVREVLRTNPSLWVGLKLRHFDKQFPALVDPPGVRVSARGGEG